MFSGEVDADSVLDPSVQEPQDMDEELVTMQSTSQHTSKGLVVRNAVLEWILQPCCKDSARTAKEPKVWSSIRKINFGKEWEAPVRHCALLPTAMPSTLKGCSVTKDTIAKAKEAIANAALN